MGFPFPKPAFATFGQNSTIMDTVLVASFQSKAEAEAAAELLKKLKGTVRMLKQEHWDDLLFGKMIDDGLAEEGEISLELLRAKLRK
jgi:hypothetical protein